jgi:PAS domain S-box-containing protein
MYSVLYVDDDPHLLEVARFFLESSGEFTVATATLATEALKLPFFSSYDAIISDYEMPRMDGITFLKKVRADYGVIPFILFTGKGREEVVIEAINNGADFYLQKGGDPTSQFAELSHKIKMSVERRRSESALQESENRYRNLYQYALVGLFETSLDDATIIACNQLYCDLAGFPSVEVALGKSVLPIYSNPEDRMEVRRILLEHGAITNHEILFINQATGRPFWAQFSARLNVKKNAAEGTIIDITERKRLEKDLEKEHGELQVSCDQLTAAKQELRDQFNRLAETERTLRINEARLRMAQRIGRTGSWEYDLATKKIWGSAEGLRIFGYPGFARDIPIADIETCIQDRDRVHQALVDLITTGQEYNIEYAINPADGSSPRVIQSIARLHKDANGKILRVIGVIHDITDRKRRENEITFKNIILATQQETSPDAILVVDQTGKILSYNRKFLQILGVPDDLITPLVDEPVLQHVVGQVVDPQAFLSRVRYLYDHPAEKSFEELQLKDGRTLERLSAPMLGENGKYFGRVWYFRDITDRKQAERLVQESNENLYQAQVIAHVGSWQYDTTSNTIVWSDETYRIFGYEPGQFDLNLENIRKQIHPHDLDKHDTILARAIATHDYPQEEYRIIRPDGTIRNIYGHGKVISDGSGSAVKIFGIIQDVTDIVKAKMAISESEEKYRLLTENILDIIYSIDLQGRITYLSPHIGRYGYVSDHLLSHHISELIPEEDLGNVLASVQTIISSGRSARISFRLKDAAGNMVWFEENSTVIKDPSGEIVGITGVLRDITDRKKAEADNWKSREILEGILNSIEVRVFWKDRNLIYLGCNTPFARDAGFIGPQDIIGKDDYAMGWHDQADLYRSDDRFVIESGKPKMFIEEPQKTPSGDIITLLTSKIPLRDADGNIIGVLGTYIDITGRKPAGTPLPRSGSMKPDERIRQR